MKKIFIIAQIIIIACISINWTQRHRWPPEPPAPTEQELRESAEKLANCLANAAEPSFGTFTDARDGQTYKTVTIDGRTWMAQNLNYKTKRGYWCYENKTNSCDKYGRLYNWETAKQVCPSGWKLPDSLDWEKLFETACGREFAGKTLKSKSGWYDNGNGLDKFGFSALPGGARFHFGSRFYNVGIGGFWWTTTGYYRHMNTFSDYVVVYERDNNKHHKSVGYSVRCVTDRP